MSGRADMWFPKIASNERVGCKKQRHVTLSVAEGSKVVVSVQTLY
jgi:hypothetical protein